MDDSLRVHAEALADLDRQIEMARPVLNTRWLEGCKRIVQRHAPEWCAEIDEGVWICSADHGVIVEWEDCPDWRDAAGQETPDAQ